MFRNQTTCFAIWTAQIDLLEGFWNSKPAFPSSPPKQTEAMVSFSVENVNGSQNIAYRNQLFFNDLPSKFNPYLKKAGSAKRFKMLSNSLGNLRTANFF